MISVYLMTEKNKSFYSIVNNIYLGINHTLVINKKFYNIDRIVHNLNNMPDVIISGSVNFTKIYVSEIIK